MKPEELLDRLRAANVELWIDGPDLRYTAPRGALDGELRTALAAAKPQVMTLLAAEQEPITDPGRHGDPFPLTEVQASYLVGRTEAFTWGGVGCHGYAEFLVQATDTARPGPERFRAAWRQVLARHDMLRCVVHPDGYQRVELGLGAPDAPTGLTIHVCDSEAAVTELRAAVGDELAHASYAPGIGPMFDLVVTIGPSDSMVHFSIDLLIADFAGITILMRDFERCLLDPASGLPPSEFTFRDYLLTAARADRGVAGRKRLERDREYWRARRDTMPPPLDVPLLPQTGETPARFSRRSLHLPAEQWSFFARCASERGITGTAALVTAFGRVLGRYGDRDHFSLTLTTANRRRFTPAVDDLVGDFTGTCVLEVDVSADESFTAMAARVGARLFDDMDHARVSGVEVLRQLSGRDDGRGPQSPVVFTSTLGASRVDDAPRLLVPIAGRGRSQTPQVLLDCQVTEVGRGIDINWDSRDLAIPDVVLDRAFADFRAVLAELSTDSGSWDRCPLPPMPPRRGEVTVRAEVPNTLLHSGFLRQAERAPDAVAIRHGDRAISYGALLSAAVRVAEQLWRSGVRPRDRVAVRLEAGAGQIAAMLGALLAGAAYVPLDTRWPEARVAQIVGQCSPAATIDPTTPIAEALTREQSWAEPPSDALAHWIRGSALVTPADTAYVIFTSGTTGIPKGVVMSHRAVVNTLEDINRRCAITAGDSVLAVSQHTFDLSVYNIFGMLAAGGCLVFPDGIDRSDPEAWARALEGHGVTVWNSVPAQLQLLLDHLRPVRDRRAQVLGGLRRILLSGDWIPVSQPAELASVAPRAVAWSLGGATEAAIWSIQHRLEPRTYERSVPYGTALRDQSVRVLTHRGEDAAPWQVGEIHIGGTGLADGYLGDPARTAAAFVTHPLTAERLYRTGDFGRVDETGVIELLGRRDNQVKIRGHRIELSDVEAAFQRIEGVAAAVACVLGDRHRPVLGAAVTAATADTGELRRRRELATAVREAGEAAHLRLTRDLPEDALARFATAAETAALHSMAAALAPALPAGSEHSFEDVVRRLGVPQRHERLLRRWIEVLTEHGLLARDRGGLALLVRVGLDECAAEWERARMLARAVDYGDELMAYVGHCLAQLPGLLAGTTDPLALLFPEGRTEVALAAYRENLLSRYVNNVLAAHVVAMARDHDPGRPLRILEIGAGVGGTSADLLAALSGCAVHYTFTDVSPFFLQRARRLLAGHAHVDYQLFDLNHDPVAQGLAESSFDLVVCANVLHNAEHIEHCLARLDRLLVPGGALAFIDSTAVNPPLMISMEFKEGLNGYTDLRAGGNSPFLTAAQWEQVLAGSAFADVHHFPPHAHVLERLGQRLFWCSKVSTACALRPSALLARMRALLPAPMVPQHVTVLPHLPLTGNGKLDRERIRHELARAVTARDTASAATPAGALTGLQSRIAAVWTSVLGLTDDHALSPRSDFYDLGGDSLLLAQCIGRMRQELPEAAGCVWDELLRAMATDSTLAGAERAVLGADAAVAADGPSAPSPLLRLGHSAPTSEPRPVVVLVHDGSGGLAPYADVIEALSRLPEPPDLYGLCRVPGDGYTRIPPEDLFTTLAAGYGRAVAGIQPASVHLVGYCMGGLLAVEIARYLAEAGVPVDGLTVISSYRVPVEIDDEDVLDYCFAQIMGVRAADLGLPDDDVLFAEAFTEARSAYPHVIPAGALRQVHPVLGRALRDCPEPGEQRLRALAESGALGGQWSADSLMQLRAIFAHSVRAVARSARDPYFGDVRFLRQRGEIHFLPTLTEDMTDFWREFCLGELTITDVEGNHFDCLARPHAEMVARLLAASWQEATPR